MEVSLMDPTQEKKSRGCRCSTGVLLLANLYLVVIMGNALYGLMASFYPTVYAQQFHVPAQPTPIHVSLIFSSFPFGMIICAPIAGWMCKKMDPKKVVLIGGLLIGCAALCFGFLGFIDVEGLYVPLAILDRTIQGIGAGMVNTGGIVVIAKGFDKEGMTTKLGLMESFAGLGAMVGPVMGGPLYEAVREDPDFTFATSFGFPFWVSGAIMTVVCLPLFLKRLSFKPHIIDLERSESDTSLLHEGLLSDVLLDHPDHMPGSRRSSEEGYVHKPAQLPDWAMMNPRTLSHAEEIQHVVDDVLAEQPYDPSKSTVTNMKVLRHAVVWTMLLVLTMGTCATGFLSATLEAHMVSCDYQKGAQGPGCANHPDLHYNLKPSEVALVFALIAFCYALTASAAGKITQCVPRPVCIIVGLWVAALGFVLTGPPQALPFLPHSTGLAISGAAVMGLGAGLVSPPATSYLLMQVEYLGEGYAEVVSGLVGAAVSVGDLAGPLVGSGLTSIFVDVVDGDGYSDAAGVFAIIVACLPFLVLASLPFRRKITDDNQHQKPSDEEGLLN